MAETAPWGNLPSYESEPPAPPLPSVNGWGIAGFVIGIVSLCAIGGLLSPIGLLLSFIGLFKTPRGWAVAGLATNLACVCCCLPGTIPIVLVASGIVSTSAMTLWMTDTFKSSLGPAGVTMFHGFVIGISTVIFYAEHQKVPESLSALNLDQRVLNDGWGRPFNFKITTDPVGYKLWSNGGDGAEGTGDDIEFRGRAKGGTLEFEPVTRPTRKVTGTGSGSTAPSTDGSADQDTNEKAPDAAPAPKPAPSAPPAGAP